MAPTGWKALSGKALGRDYPDREAISVFVQSDNLYCQPFAVLEHEDAECARVRFIKPFRGEVSLCLIEGEVASREFIAQHPLGFLSEAASCRELQEFRVAQGPIVFVERFCVLH